MLRIPSLVLPVLFGLALNAFAQAQVRTLGGGRTSPDGADAGYADGNTLQDSQFNYPSGVALDLAGNVLVADRNNGAVRKLDLSRNRASTVLSGLNRPVAIAVDRTNSLYILTEGDGLIVKIDPFGNLSTNRHRFLSPAAMALDDRNNVYVAESGGDVFRIDSATGSIIPVISGPPRKSGIAILESGLVAVSETENHRIVFFGENGDQVDQAGSGTAGFRDGPMAIAQFSQPQHLAKAPDGSLVVADHGNQRVRLIRPNGVVTTLYGVDPKAWEGPECLTCDPVILPGWFDGTAEFAEAREPVGVAVGRDGKVYSAEVYYHLIREVTGAGLTAEAAGTGSATNLVVLPPVITPDSGYFPLGEDIALINPNTNSFFSHAVYYTTDGTEPTTNSIRVALSNSMGTIRWRETTRDLTSLRVAAFVGPRSSEIVRGKSVAVNEIGVTRDIEAGPGSTIVVPVVVNLRPQDQLQSLQFRVEVGPTSSSVPPIPERLRALSISTNDLILVVTSSESGGPASFSAADYTNVFNEYRGLAITFIGANSGLSVKSFAVVAMLAVPIPSGAKLGDRYRIDVIAPSGTSDGVEAQVKLAAMPSRQIVVAPTGYQVGDSSPATWYNAPSVDFENGAVRQAPGVGPFGFGDRKLDNSDVNHIFSAALGIRVPFPFTDVFDAMDVYPEDTPSEPGGDGLIRFLDWQVTLRRSLGLDAAQWVRSWSTNGVRRVNEIERDLLPNLPAMTLSRSLPGLFWLRHALVSAEPQENVRPGAPLDLPVYLSVSAGYRVAGLAFRATLHSEGGAPPLQQSMQFIPAAGLPKPVQSVGVSSNDLLCGWPLVPALSFDPPLQRKTLLGHIRFALPITAKPGQSYTLRFSNADGSPDLRTQYDFETRPASVWVQSAALQKHDIVSDEWKIHFFGNFTDESARPEADPDQDGFSNLDEYVAGTNPTSASSALRLETPRFDPAKDRVALRWLGAPGRSYTIETSSSLLQPEWKAVARDLTGTGMMQEFIQSDLPAGARFYRLRIQTPYFQP